MLVPRGAVRDGRGTSGFGGQRVEIKFSLLCSGLLRVARNVVAIVWIAIIAIVFMLPPYELVLWTMLFVAAALTGYWVFAARRSFRGPTAG